MQSDSRQCVLFDWGNTVMRTFPQFEGPMHTWPRVEAVSGIDATLQVLARSSTLALATNAVDSDEDAIRKALERCGLSQFFEHVFCFRQLGFRKPEPDFFEGILGRLRMPLRSVFMVGDNLDTDVAAANAVGLSAVWFNPGSNESPSGELFRTIHQLSDLPSALSELGARVG